MKERALLVLLFASVMVQPAFAETRRLRPIRVEVVDDMKDLGAVVLLFDVSEIPPTETVSIYEALLEWQFSSSSLPNVEFICRSVLDELPPDGMLQADSLSLSSDPCATWEIHPRDTQRNGNVGFGRLDLSQVVTEWHLGTKFNWGVLITTNEMGSENLLYSLKDSYLLVRYGYRDVDYGPSYE